MTTDREQLIKKAAKAIADVRWNHALPHASRGGANWTDEDLARAALAVFEQALTPTDDEREALAQWLHMRFAWPHSPNERTPWLDLPEHLKDEWRDLAGDAPAGFRRTVQGEPTDTVKRAAAIAIFEGYVGRSEGFDNPAYAYDREKAEYVAERVLRTASILKGELITEQQINAERERQVAKGYTPEHDREHGIAHILRYVLHYGSRGEHLKAYAMVEAALEITSAEPKLTKTEPSVTVDREDMLLSVMEGVERWGDLLPTPEVSGYITDYLIEEGFGRIQAPSKNLSGENE